MYKRPDLDFNRIKTPIRASNSSIFPEENEVSKRKNNENTDKRAQKAVLDKAILQNFK